MPEIEPQDLSGVPETSLAALYWKAMESQRPDAMLKDEKAVALVTQMSYDFDRIRQIPMTELYKVMRIMLTREMGRYARDFLSRHPQGVVVHIGCGLDSRFERVDNGQVEWFDLDLPDVIDLRRKFIGGERERYHLVGCSVLEDAWLEAVKLHSQRPFLFLAENVFVYFIEAQVKSLVLTLRNHFPGAELVFDGWKPFELWLGNREISRSRLSARLRWGIWRGQELEGWGDGIHMLDEWGFFDQHEPRMDSFRWMAPLFRLFKPIRIFHFQLGKAPTQERRADSASGKLLTKQREEFCSTRITQHAGDRDSNSLGGTSQTPVNSRRGNAIQPLIFPGVGAQLQADQATDLRLARRQHDDGHVALAADGAAHFQSIEPGQHQIQDDQIRMLAPRDGQPLLAIAGDQYLIVGST